ncbi:MAG: 23S rRNA (uracil(1939)-C(5))-methyltransferase, partial [Pigmentiphaga sp.]
MEKNDDLVPVAQDAPVETFDDGSVRIASVDIDGRGVARRDGKVIFIEGGLVGERVGLNVYRRKPSYELAQVEHVIEASSQRVTPRCKHFGVCGGCAMQHVDAAAQVAIKQRVLEDTLGHIGKLTPKQILPAIHGPSWGYRHRARLSVRYVEKKGTVLVGFHERRSSFVADMTECHVLPPAVSALLVPLRELIGAMEARDRLPQIEVAVGEEHLVLVLRHLVPLSETDRARLQAFAAEHGVVWWLQS